MTEQRQGMGVTVQLLALSSSQILQAECLSMARRPWISMASGYMTVFLCGAKYLAYSLFFVIKTKRCSLSM